eukprot:g5114.t1
MTLRLCPSERPLDGARVTCISFSNPTLVLASLDDGRLAVWQRPAAEARVPASARGDGLEQRRALYNDAHPPTPEPAPAPPSWRQASPAVFSLLRSRMPFPQAGRRGADAEARDITTVRVPWGCLCVAGPQPTPEPDQLTTSNIFFCFRGGNKVYRTALPARSLVGGFFGGAPVEQFATQREPISCVSISAPAAGSGPGRGQGARRKSWSAVGLLGTGSTDGVAMVWDTGHTAGDLGEHNLLTVMAHSGKPVNDIAFVAGNHLAVTASSDEAVRVWRMADGTLLQSLVTGEANVRVLRCRSQGLDMPSGADTAHFEIESSGQPLGKSCVIAMWEGVVNPSIAAVPSAPSEPSTALTFAHFERNSHDEPGIWHNDTILSIPEPIEPRKVELSHPSGVSYEVDGLTDELSNNTGDKIDKEEKLDEQTAKGKSFFPIDQAMPMPRRVQPHAIEHPIVAFKSWPITDIETEPTSAASADRWANRKFNEEVLPADTDSISASSSMEGKHSSKRVFRNEILPKFANPERVQALAKVVNKQPAPGSVKNSPSTPIEPRPLGFHGGCIWLL